jgi:RNA polymerase sigma-70 factor (family 1)
MYLSSSDIENLIFKISYRDDQIAFRKLFDCYYPGLKEFARYFVKSSANAEEVVIDVFVKIWIIRGQLVEVKNIKAYLYTITKREAINYIRDNKLNTTLYVQLEDQIRVNYITPEHEFLSKETMEMLAKAIKALPPRCKLVFQMVKENGLKYKEVAQLLKISEKAVGIHISKALKSIATSISEPMSRSKVPVNKKLTIVLWIFIIASLFFSAAN